MVEQQQVTLHSAQVVYLGEKIEELREDIKEARADIKAIGGRDNSQDQDIAVVKDRVGMLMKVIGAGALLIGGLVVEAIIGLMA